MARGWESKGVEEQQSAAAASNPPRKAVLSPQQRLATRERDGLILSRQRIRQQLEQARHPPHRTMLEQALVDLDARIQRLEKSVGGQPDLPSDV